MKYQIILQGAEAILIKKEVGAAQLLADSRCAPLSRNYISSLRSQVTTAPQIIVLKRRVAKGYRIKELDEKIRKLRTRGEARLLEKVGKIIPVPCVYKVDEKSKEIDMEFISGLKLSDNLDEMKNWKEVCFEIGRNIAKLHDAGIIHGDLTTSNMIWAEEKLNYSSLVNKAHLNSVNSLRSLRQPVRKLFQKPEQDDKFDLVDDTRGGWSGKGKLYFIDFGLGFSNGRVEDKAVDLYLIKEALEAKHFSRFEEYFKEVLRGYKISESWKEVLKRLEKVEKRGRYKEQY